MMVFAKKKIDNSQASGKFSEPITVAEKLAKRFPKLIAYN